MTDHTKDRHAALAEVIQFQARNELHRHFPEASQKPRKQSGVGLLFILAPWAVFGLGAAGYFSRDIVEFLARVVGQ